MEPSVFHYRALDLPLWRRQSVAIRAQHPAEVFTHRCRPALSSDGG